MSALPPKADIDCARPDVRFVPKADIEHPSSHPVIGGTSTASVRRVWPCSVLKYLAAVAKKTPAPRPTLYTSRSRLVVGAMWYRVWSVFFGRKRPADPRVTEIRRPAKSDFHTIVTKTGLSVTFKPTNSTYIFVTDNPLIARLGPVSFIGVQHKGCNTEDYNSDEVEAMARQVASETASIHFCDFFD